jgi:hypothetical protein
MELAAAEEGRVDPVPKRSARAIVRAQLERAARGDTQAFLAIADRIDGKPVQAIVGDDEHPPVVAFQQWLAWMADVRIAVAQHPRDTEIETRPVQALSGDRAGVESASQGTEDSGKQ